MGNIIVKSQDVIYFKNYESYDYINYKLKENLLVFDGNRLVCDACRFKIYKHPSVQIKNLSENIKNLEKENIYSGDRISLTLGPFFDKVANISGDFVNIKYIVKNDAKYIEKTSIFRIYEHKSPSFICKNKGNQNKKSKISFGSVVYLTNDYDINSDKVRYVTYASINIPYKGRLFLSKRLNEHLKSKLFEII